MTAERAHAPARALAAGLALALLLLPAGAAPPAPPGGAPAASPAAGSGATGTASASGWVEVDYSALVDTRRLTHSGESIGMVLHQLAGRPYPARGAENQDDATAHVLLDPLLEPYAFVLSDALDTLGGGAAGRWVDVGTLWAPSEAQPAWAELLRARHYLVESDGTGKLRVCLPWKPPASRTAAAADAAAGSSSGPSGALPSTASDTAAKQAWDDAWPILRHVFAAERRRLAAKGRNRPEDHPLDVEVHPYVHLQARTVFQLGVRARAEKVTSTASASDRPPVDLAAWQRFLDRKLQLEGGRLEPDGSLRLLGSEPAQPPTLLGRPVTLADFAVAWRAVAHGGLGEPYMSLDRGASPQTSIVNYGGRLRDTSLGLVSLLCDARFKTLSLGLDIVTGLDERDRVRRELPEFRTQYERFAADAGSKDVISQQVRLWFYPDTVDLTLSREGDVLVVRRARMSAASERVQQETFTSARTPDPPWTTETIAAINRDYESLARFFPELADLDQVVRLLSFFTWLRAAGDQDLLIPDLDALLALELPAQPTPRTFPQLLALSAVPPAGSGQPVVVYNRTTVGEAFDRLQPATGDAFPAARRLARARASLDLEGRGDQRALARELDQYDVKTLDDSEIDLLAYRAERLRMHQIVTNTLPSPGREEIEKKKKDLPGFRALSSAIGGLDLGMGKALARAAAGRNAGAAPGESSPPTRPRPRATGPYPDPALPATALPPHGVLGAGEAVPAIGAYVQSSPAQGVPLRAWIQTIAWADGPDPTMHRVILQSGGGAGVVERLEEGRFLRYRMEAVGTSLRARLAEAGLPPGSAAIASDFRRLGTARSAGDEAAPLPAGLATLERGPAASDANAAVPGANAADTAAADPASGAAAAASASEPSAVRVRLRNVDGHDRSAAVPRAILQRIVLGHEVDLAPERPLPGLSPASSVLGSTRRLMVLMDPLETGPPWGGPPRTQAGEEDAARLAQGLRHWWSSEGAGESPVTVVGVDRSRSPQRWQAAGTASKAFLLLPEDGFPGASSDLRARIAQAWRGGASGKSPTESGGAPLVVLVSAEDPALLGARLRELARSDAMKGRFLAIWSLGGPVRPDMPASLLAEGKLSAIGLPEYSPIASGRVLADLGTLGAALAGASGKTQRPEELPGPLVWFY